MSRRLLGVLVVLSLPLARRAAGQALDTASLHHRADSLLALWRQANTLGEVQQAVREVRRQRSSQVTRATAALRGEHPVQAGNLMVVADFPDSIPLRAAADRAWHILSTTYGGAAAPLVAQPIHISVIFSERQVVTNGRRVPHKVTVDELARTLIGMAGQSKVDARLARWLGNTVHPVLDTVMERGAVYVQLVTAGSAAATACFNGALAGCAAALQLSEDSLFYLTVYDARQRRGSVAGARSREFLDPTDRATYIRCVDDRVDSACVDFLRGLPPQQIPQPLTFQARNLLVSTAEAMGGPGAYDRLVADTTAPIVTRLERAANAPVDRIVGAWRAQIVAARPLATQVPMGDAAVALGWVGLIAFGAVRSTRWRLS